MRGTFTPGSSLEHLKKEAKRWLKALRDGDAEARKRFGAAHPRPPAAPGLRDVQFALARELGFEGWMALLAATDKPATRARLRRYEQMAEDILAGSAGDAAAINRLIAIYGVSYDHEQVKVRLQARMKNVGAGETPTLADARLSVAREHGFADWAAMVVSLMHPQEDRRATKPGGTSTPPFYGVDEEKRRIDVRLPMDDGDWDVIIGVMREQRLTEINAQMVPPGAMAKLAELDFVTAIRAGQGTGDDALLHLAAMPQLELLEIGGWHSPVTDRGLEVLRDLRGLKTFHCGWAQRITDAGVAWLTYCDDITDVNVMGSNTGDGLLNALRGKPKLAALHTGRKVTDRGLPLLHDFPVFRTWHGGEIRYGLMTFGDAKPNHLMLDGPFTHIRPLAGLEGLFALNFFWHTTGMTAAGLAPLKDLPRLGMLGVDGKLCTDEAMRHIAAIPDLRMLMAQGTVATDDGFEALGRSRTIEHLWGRECPGLGDRGFAALSRMPALQAMAVSCKGVSDAALALLPSFPSLTGLLPMDVKDDGFRHVGRCERLEKLWCMYCRDTGDVATEHVKDLELTHYYAGASQITDRSLEILGRMPTLEEVEFWQIAGITNEGLKHLAALPKLRKVGIDAPQVTREGLAVFPPRVKVNF